MNIHSASIPTFLGAARLCCLALSAGVALFCAGSAHAGDALPDAKVEMTTKVAVLDLERAVMMTDVAREKIKTMQSQKEYADMQTKIEGLQKDMDKKVADAQKNGPTWTVEQQANSRKEMEFIQKDYELAAQKLQAQNQDLERDIMKDMDQKIRTVVNQILTDEKITILLKKDAAFFAAPSAEITEEVTAKLNKAQ